MMEKYGTDLNSLPPTDEQYREVKKLAGEKSYNVPRTYAEAEELIEKLARDVNE